MGFQDVNDTARAQGPEGVRNRSDGARPIGNGDGRWEAPAAPALATVNAAFRKWLVLKDLTPVHAVLGAVAANFLPGDPVWLGLIAPPSTAKTEILNALARIPHVEAVATLSMAALLSGTPKGQKAAGAKGGLLRKIGDFGVLVLKDFGSILSMQRDGQAETLAALREIYDGSWTRHVGSDGGKTLHWQGKLGLVFGATEAFDDRHAVISSLGDRFLSCRLNPASGRQQLKAAFDHTGATTTTMRAELADAVAGLFAVAVNKAPRPLAETERERLGDAVKLAVRLRAHVERDRHSREIESIHGAEGPGRIGLCLERLLAGLDVIGLDRDAALTLVQTVARHSCPPIRVKAFDLLNDTPQTTRAIGDALRLPTTTTRRILEDLLAQGLAVRERGKDEDGEEKKGGADEWRLDAEWEDLWEND
jgi:hypothetical protein